jgi:hypothetical protein
MSHRFTNRKDPFSHRARLVRKFQEVGAQAAAGIRNQADLDRLLEGADPITRKTMVAVLSYYLPFVPDRKEDHDAVCVESAAT